MTQKEILTNALGYAQTSFGNDAVKKKAARAFCVIAWLRVIAWVDNIDYRDDINALLEHVENLPDLNIAFKVLEDDDRVTSRLYHIANLLCFMFAGGLDSNEWSATHGAPLTDELWHIINLKR